MTSSRLLVMQLGLPLILGLVVAPMVYGQPQTKDGSADLRVEGLVARLFESHDGTQLVELRLQSVALENGNSVAKAVRIPAPGETIYVVIEPVEVTSEAIRSGTVSIPTVGYLIRAVLREGKSGQWIGAGDWFKSLGGLASLDVDEPANSRFERASSTVEVLGMSCEAKLVGGQLGLEVIRVDNATPAKEAGFQVGDVVVAINRRPLTSAADLLNASSGREAIDLTVIDVNTGQIATVSVKASEKDSARPDSSRGKTIAAGADPTVQIAMSLGIAVEPSRDGLRRAVKVTSIKEGSAAEKAGIELGDLIVKVGGKRVSSVAEFASAIPSRPGVLLLGVQDVRSGQEVPVEVESAGFDDHVPNGQLPQEKASHGERKTGKLGIVGELAFYEAEAAVKVARVIPGSGAQRAGIRPGMILLSMDGKPLLHPDDLAQAEKAPSGRVKLRVVNPSTQGQLSVEVEL